MKVRPLGGSAPKLPEIQRATRARAPAVRGGRSEAPAAAHASQAAGGIAARLRSGEIAPKEAISMLVDETVGRLQGSPALRRQVRTALERIAGQDPGLLAVLQRARSGR